MGKTRKSRLFDSFTNPAKDKEKSFLNFKIVNSVHIFAKRLFRAAESFYKAEGAGAISRRNFVVSTHDFNSLRYNVFVLFESDVTIMPLGIITRDATSVNLKKDRGAKWYLREVQTSN